MRGVGGRLFVYLLILVSVLLLLFAVGKKQTSGPGVQASTLSSPGPAATGQAPATQQAPTTAVQTILPALVAPSPSPSVAVPSYDPARDWPLADFDAAQLWRYTQGAGIRIAIVGTGVDVDHPDLAPAVIKVISLDGGKPGDDTGDSRGTEIAGLIAGRGPAAGRAGLPGLAPQAELIDVRVTSEENHVSAAEIIDGINAAVGARAQIIDIPLGVAQDNKQLDAAVTNAEQAHHCIVIASAGAGGAAQWPADSSGVIAVAATSKAMTPTGSLDNYGPNAVYAPGQDLYSTVAGPGGYQGNLSGNDLATAYVSAAAALLLAPAAPGLGPEPEAIRSRLAKDVTRKSASSRDFGVLNPAATLQGLSIRLGQGVTASPQSTVLPTGPAVTSPPVSQTPTINPTGTGTAAVGPGGQGNVVWTVVLIVALMIIVLTVLLWFFTRGGPSPPRGLDRHIPRDWDLEPR